MTVDEGAIPEETLDPNDWRDLRVLGHRMVDDMLTYLQTVRERKVWQPLPDGVRAGLHEPMPVDPSEPTAVYEEFRRKVLPYPTGNIHPRFWGWVIGTGTPMAALAEMLAAGMNPSVSMFDDAANAVEQQVIEWLKELMGFPAEASGLLVSGASMANLVGLAVARNSRSDFDVRRRGVAQALGPLTLYASSETHSSVVKAVELLGLGSDNLRLLPVGRDLRLDLAALKATIEADRKSGRRPLAVIGNAGTVNTGAIDDLGALAQIASREGLWLHVDGAYAALAVLSPRLRPRLSGLERADSLAFDLHKWGYLPIEVACILVRQESAHRNAFVLGAEYLKPPPSGLAARSYRFSDIGLQLSRSFRALKVWMLFKEHGTSKLGRLVQQNVEQAAYLARRIEETTDLELIAAPSLNIVCFRFVGSVSTEATLDTLNRDLLIRLQEGGLVVLSGTVLNGQYVLRAAITNHRSRREDFDLLVRETARLGRDIADKLVRSDSVEGD